MLCFDTMNTITHMRNDDLFDVSPRLVITPGIYEYISNEIFVLHAKYAVCIGENITQINF